jgi:OmpR-family two-component system manganese-sensing sensor histidine kinase
MFQATRRRLALWYTGVTAILLLVFASGFYVYVRGTLIERVDDTLAHVVEVVQRSLILEPTSQNLANSSYQVNLEASLGNPPAAVEDDRIDLEWFSPTGELLWSTLTVPLEVPLHLSHHGETVEIDADYWLRQWTQRLMIDDQVLGYLRVSHPWFEVTKPARQLMIDLSLGLSLMIGLVAAIGWGLSRLAIAPIRDSYQQLKQFTADASHELRNPIALIQTNVQVALADPNPDPQEQRQQLEVVERVTQRLGRLVDDLLFLARQDSGMAPLQTQPCPLDAILVEVVEEQEAFAQAHQIQISLDIEEAPIEEDLEDPFTLIGDSDQLVRLFTNLVSNGIQYTPPGGQVQIKLQRCIWQGALGLQVEITDSGLGIPSTALPHVFDRFYRCDPARKRVAGTTPPGSPAQQNNLGTGLGLAIAQAISHNHQGQIRVTSRPHQGTTFTVMLPLTPS